MLHTKTVTVEDLVLQCKRGSHQETQSQLLARYKAMPKQTVNSFPGSSKEANTLHQVQADVSNLSHLVEH
jgi:hypothetical protein